MIIQTVKAEALSHEFKVSIPANDISEKITLFIQEKAKTFKMDGFRPGKAPLHVVKNQYEGAATEKALDQFIKDSIRKITQDNKIVLATEPNLTFDEYAPGKDFSFTVVAESMPVFEVNDFSKISLDKYVTEVTDEMVEKRLQKIADNNLKFSKVDDSYAIQEKDFVEFSMVCELDGKKVSLFTKESVRGLVGEIYLDKDLDLSTALKGQKKGADVSLTRTLPDDVSDQSLKGKKVSLKLKVIHIDKTEPHTVSEDFAKDLGYKTLEECRQGTKDRLNQEVQGQAFICHKRYLLDALAKEYKFDLPSTMVKNEFDLIWEQLQRELKEAKEAGTLDSSDDKSEAELRKEYEALAERRVRLGILISKIAATHKISVSSEMLANAIIQEAARHLMAYQQVLDFYKNNYHAREQLRSSILENEVVRFVLDKVSLKEVKVTHKQLVDHVKAVLPDFKSDEDEEEENEAVQKKKPAAKAKKETEAA